MVRERSEVQWGRTKIPYDIKRSRRRRTVALTVGPPGSLVLTAPKNTPVERLDELVRAKARWITTRLRAVRPLGPHPIPREFVSGESFLYLGRQFRLDVRRGRYSIKVQLERGRFRVDIPAKLRGGAKHKAVKLALARWYRAHAEAHLTERVKWWASRLDVVVPKVFAREQERRWGSCAPGVVRFNWRIVQAPMRLLDYVVAHEVTHLLYDDHSKAFWAALGRVLPSYESLRSDLRTLGPRLQW